MVVGGGGMLRVAGHGGQLGEVEGGEDTYTQARDDADATKRCKNALQQRKE